ncbi:MAG: LytR family transcriptional regulator [Cellulosilyticum sp.]|nr:LytR family transcriptional regulator [Cellulosilyticum sp.]
MEQDKKRFSSRQKKTLLRTFLIAAAVTFVLCVIILIAGITIYNSTLAAGATSEIQNELTEEEQVFEDEKKEVSELNKTIAVFGVDEDEIRTDVIFVVNLNTITNKVKVVSIPRDTKVIWTDKQKRAYNQLTGNSISISKINEMAAYGRINQNIGNIRDFTIDEIENILRIHVDSYVVINLEAFREIVDAIGGVDMYVPQDMYYVDNYQGLYIDLEEGMQHLDGDAAEGLVRFRRYPRGDEARVEVQQTFLKAVAEKVMSQSVSSLASMVTRLFPYVKTDIKLNEVLGYLDLLKEFSLSGLTFHTVPGVGADYEGPSYYYIDEEKLDDMITEVFLDTTVQGEEPIASDASEEVVVDTTVEVAVYNAAGVKGVAGRYKDKLQAAGYNVVKVDNHSETGLEDSTIYAKDKSKALQFFDLVPGAEIVEDTSIEYDIEIVVGSESIE